MSSPNADVNFALIMASAVHDMKNSLSMVLHSLHELSSELQQNDVLARKVGLLQYEASRVNNDLVQLLVLYRLQNKQLPLHIDEHFVHDFLDEQIARYAPIFTSRDIQCELVCDENLVGYFDQELLTGVINNILSNAIRYTQNQIRVEARQADDYLEISINDNGRGYPQAMLEMPEDFKRGINFETGSTNLGLYFASQIAQLHQQKERQGHIKLSNGGALAGGLFRLYLP